MTEYTATKISGTIITGKVRLYKQRQYTHFKKSINEYQVESELIRLKTGIKQLEADITTYLEDPEVSQLDKDILSTHLMIVTDIEITNIIEDQITNQLVSAPQAVLSSFEKIIDNFKNLDNNFFAQRADDYKDVRHRLMLILLGASEIQDIKFDPQDIVFLYEITPSLVSTLSKAGVKAYCAARGSQTSHSSILTRSMGFTAVVARDINLASLKDGETAILDATNGKIIINPDAKQAEEYKRRLRDLSENEIYLKSQLELPSITKNKITISVKANVEYPGEIGKVIENNCDGIGLFRTEFIYLNRYALPDEGEQVKVYSELLTKLKDQLVIIRTFDLGGDKISFLQQHEREENPNLGNRGIRFSLHQRSLFRTQARAILRASVYGKAGIMFPMIISTDDFLNAKKVIMDCMEELDNEAIPYDKNIKIGAMIETPSAAICADQLAKICDFFSIGTNDLVQYTLAVDRNNDRVAPYYIQYHPAVILLIKQTIAAAKKSGIPISICGEMASELMFVPLLVGLGIEELSINPAKSAEVKMVIRNCDEKLINIISSFDFNSNTASIEHLLKVTLKPYYTLQS